MDEDRCGWISAFKCSVLGDICIDEVLGRFWNMYSNFGKEWYIRWNIAHIDLFKQLAGINKFSYNTTDSSELFNESLL